LARARLPTRLKIGKVDGLARYCRTRFKKNHFVSATYAFFLGGFGISFAVIIVKIAFLHFFTAHKGKEAYGFSV
jgi:hypothetical protein